jgi:hypothetical protein
MVEAGMTLKQAILAETKFMLKWLLVGVVFAGLWALLLFALNPATFFAHPFYAMWSFPRIFFPALAFFMLVWTFVRDVRRRMDGRPVVDMTMCAMCQLEQENCVCAARKAEAARRDSMRPIGMVTRDIRRQRAREFYAKREASKKAPRATPIPPWRDNPDLNDPYACFED